MRQRNAHVPADPQIAITDAELMEASVQHSGVDTQEADDTDNEARSRHDKTSDPLLVVIPAVIVP